MNINFNAFKNISRHNHKFVYIHIYNRHNRFVVVKSTDDYYIGGVV